jgi:LssY C-terminus
MIVFARLALVLLLAAGAASPNPPWRGLPMRTQTHAHVPGDPVNIAFEGSRAAILKAFARIGWVQADALDLKNDVKLAEAALLRKPYPRAPVSNLYLFGRAEDFAVEHENGSVSKRDHARFWDTNRQDGTTHLELWIGDASRDIAIEPLYRRKFPHIPIGTTHRIDGNLDAERDLIVHAVQAAGLVAAVVREPGIGATRNGTNGGGDHFSTDGQVTVVVLK